MAKRVRVSDLGATFLPDGAVMVRAPMRGIGAKVPPFAVELLAFLSVPRSADEIAGRYGPKAVQMADQLAGVGLLVDEYSEATVGWGFFENFAAIDVHRRMLGDEPRMHAYLQAIIAAVKPGMAVLDAGTGSGVLAVLAARAGARVVYAVDGSDILDVAKDAFRASGVGERVVPIRGDFRTVSLPEKVDVIVTETFGAFGLAEDGLTDIAACAANNLAPGGVILPEAMALWLAPVGGPRLVDEALGPFRGRAGVEFPALLHSAHARGLTTAITPGDLLHPGAAIGVARLGTPPKVAGKVDFEVHGAITGWAGWFDLHFPGAPTLSTAPAATATHWKQQFLAVDPPIRADGPVSVDVALAPPAEDRRGLEVTARWNTGGASGSTWHRLR
jgi:SAM-dependent methyltransferase